MTVRDDLVAARALIDTPEKWVRGRWSDTAETCFCAYGAIMKASQGYSHELSVSDALRVGLPRGVYSIVTFNDAPTTTHADILALYDRAIAASA